ncbi:MAG: hypothetical protein VYA67_06470 [Actinomycetota bacterium]|uniref:Sulfotransferase family protein n=1 Tax=Mycobacterium lentiflavum TaxID=141349 RepID=A0ABY3US48_MYCLN|nr:hypothetical protein [Mycobacterium lentiflavum]MEE3063598.1 hypothetical protein [Actinomycetota bacterium]ULP42422.1 hypothetical protein MJO58_27245 [Mycobacterium lentiflavum]
MGRTELADWTPIRLDFSGPAPAVWWADLSGERFTDPFFDQTVARWESGPTARPLVRTGLDELEGLDGTPSLDPAGIIFHLSRCGSTLVSRLLGTLPGIVVVAEPAPLNSLLGLDPAQVDPAFLVKAVRLLVRALGRRRHGDERRLVLKCTSWNIVRREVLAAAFPQTPWIWVQRDPARVLASLLAEPPGWLAPAADLVKAAPLFGIDPTLVPAMERAEFAARALAAMLEAAADQPVGRLVLDHADLPDAVWACAAPHFGLPTSADAIDRMAEQSRFYSKDRAPRPFAGGGAEERPVSEATRKIAERFAAPGYRALDSVDLTRATRLPDGA